MIDTSSIDARVDELTNVAFWKEHFPKLTINKLLADWDLDTGALPSDTRRLYSERMAEEGFFQDRSATLSRLAPLLAEAVRTCRHLDIPPAFIFLFDETWKSFYALQPLLKHFLGEGYMILPDFWVWYVEPQLDEAGWRPHRDKGRLALGPNREPLSLTIWAPLVEASPENSCIYILPINRDPVYATAEENNCKFDLPHMRALPGQPGDFFCWNQAVFHWGGASSRFARHPRISMALEFQRGDREPFNRPLIKPLDNLTFGFRLKLIGKQILQYRHMYPLTAPMEHLAERLLGLGSQR